jgi:hypothetical protein
MRADSVRRLGGAGGQEVGQATNGRVDAVEHLLQRGHVADVQDRGVGTGHLARVGIDLNHVKPSLKEHVGDQAADVAEADDGDPRDAGWG